MQHHAKKRFGQNFLVDTSIINLIVDSIQPETEDLMIEIGPGLGAMTKPLLSRLNHLNVIELDRDIIPKLINNCIFSDATNKHKLTVNQQDVLKFDFENFHSQHPSGKKLRIVGNLPYNISTPVLFHLLKYRYLIQDMHFMLQKEVVDRIVAVPGIKNYGRLSVMLQTFCETQSLFEVPPYAFQPAPKVDSAILRLQPKTQFENIITDFTQYEKLIRQAFSQRRKTLKNTLKDLCSIQQIEQAGLSPGQRAEELSISDFVNLYKTLKTL
ncbi:SSU rRNA (adenine(1518)-N(6)/adenine(1519)-N(6))-dimethyltransferase [hydrothermal vent metagenome]|uniref:SSU rRNA (Adenine(1518)-N(6)/adenine(1519)-N(6))-dimethyltransferase n=1 Tax=hydrothermal vent metagenome TaxID=652676 RepID=A0A3B0WHM5_9ZZZZ